ncbi:helix-turn-helix domain-containing protein [Bradyrhizobium sp. CCGB20]|uniref:helix-turn-helix domain-containing protein n=1 Tax=Bradyrhizobium sp. CCGB20 TaxID=2949633 RepID=UPI0020B2FF5A|nr:helix-turn-helix domain-containing protein [Bradyrhizobium sp. CCGB20]MCP3397155.1 helix-turn-helix domain-containing protein [Bradyrhizobium sp. CCGB20]
MKDTSLLAAQIRAARAILGWSQAYLAEGANVNKSTIVDLESDRRMPHDITLMVVLDQLTAAGIDFTDDGVRIREWPLKPYVPVGIRQKEVRSAPPPPANAGAESIKNLVSSRTGRKL